MKKRLLAVLLLVVMAFGTCAAACAVELNDDAVFFKQGTRRTCTLASVSMLLRRKAIVDGDADWASITESSVGKVAWTKGLAWNFTYNGVNITVQRKASGWGGNSLADKKAYLIELLESHPEGVVAYDTSKPHAVLLTDYDAQSDTFYCCDPAAYYPAGRIPLDQCSNNGAGQDGKLKNISQLWYAASGLSKGAGTMPAAEVGDPGRENAEARLSTQEIEINGKRAVFHVYVLEDAAGNETCYVDITDLAAALSGSARQFDVALTPDETSLFSGIAYPYSGIGALNGLPLIVPAPLSEAVTKLDGTLRALDNIQVTDEEGGRHVYYKLRDLGEALDFTVGWDAERGTYIETEAM